MLLAPIDDPNGHAAGGSVVAAVCGPGATRPRTSTATTRNVAVVPPARPVMCANLSVVRATSSPSSSTRYVARPAGASTALQPSVSAVMPTSLAATLASGGHTGASASPSPSP